MVEKPPPTPPAQSPAHTPSVALDGFFRIREAIGLPLRIALGVSPIIILFFFWVLLTHGAPEERVISALILPSPAEVVQAFRPLWFDAELSRSIVASARRVVGGFLVALSLALPLGLLMGSFTKIKAMFDPLSVFGAYLPIPALVPLTMSIFGTNERQKIMFLALAFFVYLLPMFVKAIDAVEDTYLQIIQTLGATKWQAVRHVLLGISLPHIYQAMRLGFGVGWSYIILAEVVDAKQGLGHIIQVAQRRGLPGQLYLTIIIIVLIAFVTDKIWVKLGRRLFPYQEFT